MLPSTSGTARPGGIASSPSPRRPSLKIALRKYQLNNKLPNDPSNPSAPPGGVADRIGPLLAELRHSATGRLISEHIQDVLQAYAGYDGLGIDLIRSMLDAWGRRLPPDSTDAVEIRLLQLRLSQVPNRAEAESLNRRIRALAERMALLEPSPASEVSPPAPASAELAQKPEAQWETPPPSTAREDVLADEPPSAAPEGSVSPPPPDKESIILAPRLEPDIPVATAARPGADELNGGIDFTYRRALQEKRERLQKIQETLVHHINEVIQQNEKFGMLLEFEDDALGRTDERGEIEDLRRALLSEVRKLRGGHQTLTKKLDTAAKYLQIIGTEGQHLNEELTRVHILSLTDELTDLPNRRAFLRRLEDEVARVQRYGYPLSLALIDMDGFKAINDKYGHAAGDEVLRVFATNVLSTFRHHDMVARYGGEEFAVLLPNTDREGATRALEKVRKRTEKSSFHSDGRTLPMPTFSAGISLYKPGETPSSLIERADKALYQAKRMGRNRIELAEADGPEATAR
jgi:diguanylate cyclase